MKLTAELTAKLINSPAFVGTEMVRLLEECRERIQLEVDREYEINVFCAAIQWAAHVVMLVDGAMDAKLSDMVLLILGVMYAMGRVDERMYGPPEEEATAEPKSAMEDFLSSLFERGNGKDT